MSRKKNAAAATAAAVLVTVLVLVFIGLLCSVLYAARSFPAFNKAVDSVFSFAAKKTEDTAVSSADEETSAVSETEPFRESIMHLIPVFAETDMVSVPADGGNSAYTVSHDGYVLNGPQGVWSYASPYPIVSAPGLFADTVVFIDASPSLIGIDRFTGLTVLDMPCPVYPEGGAYTDGYNYVFKARAGGWYSAFFSETDAGSGAAPNTAVHTGVSGFDGLLYASFMPDEAVMQSIISKMNGIISMEPAAPLAGGLLYTEADGILRFSRGLFSPLIVFSPAEQGMYTFGLCGKDGSWIKDKAFIAVFTGTGEMRSMSLDYVADRPQITMHLSDAEMYYICAGFMSAGASDAAYFQVKKAP